MSTAAVKKVAAASKVDDTTKENVQVLLRCRLVADGLIIIIIKQDINYLNIIQTFESS
jgi:hypothetical protein